MIQLLQEVVTRENAIGLLEQAAEEFDRRAMSPEYGAAGMVTAERARILGCSQWLRDMAYDLTSKD